MTLKKPTAGIILAAGISTRFGRPKQLLKFRGKLLMEWVVNAASKSRLHDVYLVLGYRYREIIDALGKFRHDPKMHVVINHRYREGQGSSIKAGLLKIGDRYPSVMFLVADQPMLDTGTIDLLLDRFWQSDKDICIPVFKGQPGNPTIFTKRMYTKILQLREDAGARSIVNDNPGDVLRVAINNPSALVDIDTRSDLKRFE